MCIGKPFPDPRTRLRLVGQGLRCGSWETSAVCTKAVSGTRVARIAAGNRLSSIGAARSAILAFGQYLTRSCHDSGKSEPTGGNPGRFASPAVHPLRRRSSSPPCRRVRNPAAEPQVETQSGGPRRTGVWHYGDRSLLRPFFWTGSQATLVNLCRQVGEAVRFAERDRVNGF